jgi:hypothetical protein
MKDVLGEDLRRRMEKKDKQDEEVYVVDNRILVYCDVPEMFF